MTDCYVSVIQVQAVLLVLGGSDMPPGLVSMAVPTTFDEKVSMFCRISTQRLFDYF
jgi:hypothetical protein